MDDTNKILHSAFDMKTHKENFINYLEVVILEDGTIEYAVPSYNKKLEEICCKKLGLNYNELDYENKELIEYFENLKSGNWWCWYEWLYETSKAVCVWNDRYMGAPNKEQLQKIKELKEYGLYYGFIDKKIKGDE